MARLLAFRSLMFTVLHEWFNNLGSNNGGYNYSFCLKNKIKLQNIGSECQREKA